MSERFVSAVALYGRKREPVRGYLAGLQELLARHVGEYFRPYSLEQIHATLIAFNQVADPATGAIVNEYYLEHTGAGLEMDADRAMRILSRHFARPLRIRFGGFRPGEPMPFLSRGQHLSERSFSVQGNAFVLIGWPWPAEAGQPLDRLRRDMNAANVLHRYHRRDGDIDDDFYLVVGHHAGAPAGTLEQGAAAIRDKLAADPIEIEVGIADVKIVAADSHTLAPPLFAGAIPVDAATIHEISGHPLPRVSRRPALAARNVPAYPACARVPTLLPGPARRPR